MIRREYGGASEAGLIPLSADIYNFHKSSRGPRNFMVLNDSFPKMTTSGRGSSGFTTIFAENKAEDAVLELWFPSAQNHRIEHNMVSVDAVKGTYGSGHVQHNFVLTSAEKAERFQMGVRDRHPQMKIKRIDNLPPGFEKWTEE